MRTRTLDFVSGNEIPNAPVVPVIAGVTVRHVPERLQYGSELRVAVISEAPVR